MQLIFKFLARLLLVAAGLVFAASLMLFMGVLLALWLVRALWCKLTGKPVNPFADAMRTTMQSRMNPRAGFERVFQSAGHQSTKPTKPRDEDVIDVEVKEFKDAGR